MSSKKLKKEKKSKKQFKEDEISESSEEEEDSAQNNYVKGDFVVSDNEVEESGEDGPMYLREHNGEEGPKDVELDKSFASSDLEVGGIKGKKKKKKKLRRQGRVKDEEKLSISDNELKEEDQFEDEEKNENDEEGDYHREGRTQAFKLNEEEERRYKTNFTKKSIKDIYSAEELEAQFATEKDKKIMLADYPERMVLRYGEENLPKLVNDIEKESGWMFEKLKLQLSSMDTINNVRKKIHAVLELNKQDFLEYPFIVTYRKYVFEPELTVNDVWKLCEYDQEWQELSEYRENVIKQFKRVREYLDEDTAIFMFRRYIDGAKSIDELKSMEIYIHFLCDQHANDLYAKEEIQHKKENGHIRPLKKSFVTEAIKNKINDYTEKFSLKANDLAYNLELILNNESTANLIEAPEPDIPPGTLALEYVGSVYKEEYAFMTEACKYLAVEMGSQPFIRQYVWNYLRNNCYLSTEPTEQGKTELDVFNPSFKTKRISKRPVTQFNNDLYLDIMLNEKKGLIKTKIEIHENEEDFKEISGRIGNAYISKSEQTLGWNIMREEAIRVLIREVVSSQFKKEIREELAAKAEKYVINECGQKFFDILNTGPYKRKHKSGGEDDIFRENVLPRVMSFVYEPNKRNVYCVMLNKYGEVIDHYIFSFLATRMPKSQRQEDRQLFYEEQKKCKDLILQHKPNLIVIGANDLKCRFLKEQIINCNPDMMKFEEDNDAFIWVTFGDLAIPCLYANSMVSEKSFPNYNVYLKQAVSLGRYQQNPLEEILQLWSEDINKNFCLKIELHRLQSMVNQKKLMEMLELKAIQVVNAVGVEINRAFNYSHLRSTVMFVSGFGPRKAQELLESLIKTKGLAIRTLMVEQDGIQKKVFTNCMGFFKITPEIEAIKSGKGNYYLLDMTRIHQESYKLANKLIKSAVDDEKGTKDNKDNELIAAILRDPKKLEVLDINDYIKDQSEVKGQTDINALRFNLNFIFAELNAPFADPRKEHKDLSPSELFSLFIGDENFKVGQITVAKVIKVDEQHVKCRLMNDLEATVWIKDIFEDGDKSASNAEMKNRYKEGTIFEARIKSINENTFKVDLITKPSVMMNHKQYMNVSDLYHFDLKEEDLINKKYQRANKEDSQKYIPRRILHEKFKNVSCRGAIDFLRNKDIGDCIFRPSSKGTNNITLTWKFYKHIFCHLDIVEEDKIPGSAISSKLRIGNEIYGSLNEIVDRYINPCKRLIKEVISFRKFLECESKAELEKKLKSERAKDSSIIHYFFTILKDYPQYIILGYIPKQDMVCEYIKVKPNGLFFHQKYFPDIEDVIGYFKKGYGTSDYNDYVRKTRPPNIEYRRKIESSNMTSADNDTFSSGNQGGSYNNRGPRDMSKIECRICHQLGHMQATCPERDRRDRRNDRGDRGDRDRRDRFNRGKRDRSPRQNDSEGGGKRRDMGYHKRDSNNYSNSWGRNNNDSNNNNESNNASNNGWGSSNNNGWGTTNNETSKNASNDGWGTTNNETSNNASNNGWGTTNNETSNNASNNGWGTTDVSQNTSNNGWGNVDIKQEPKQDSNEWGDWPSGGNDNKSNNGWGSSNVDIKKEPSGW